MRFNHWLYLSEQGAIEGHSVETVHCPHRNVQVHQKPFLLQCVDCGTNPLCTQTSQVDYQCHHRADISKIIWCPVSLTSTSTQHFTDPIDLIHMFTSWAHMLNTFMSRSCYFKAHCIYRVAKSGNLSSRLPAYLDGHDNTTGHMFHLVHHPIRSPPQLCNLLQIICLHHKVLDGGGRCYITLIYVFSSAKSRTACLRGTKTLLYLISNCDTSFRVKISRRPAVRKQHLNWAKARAF